MAITVTATQGGSTTAGMVLRVFVLTQAKVSALQSGGSGNAHLASATAFTVSVTTTQTGSRVYGACAFSPNGTITGNASTTIVDSIADATHGERYVSWKATALTGTPGATTFGGTTASSTGPIAGLEILTAGTLTEDGSAPAVVSTTAATTLTTASFAPPPGSLLVALVGSDGGASVTTMTVSGGGLGWTEKVKNNPSGGDYAGVWIASVPATGQAVTPPLIPPGLFTTPGAQFPAPLQGDPSFVLRVVPPFTSGSDFVPGLAQPGFATPANPDVTFTTAEGYIGSGYQPPQAPPFAPGFATPSSWAQPGTGLTDPSWTGPPAPPSSSLPQFLDQSGSRPRGAFRVRHGAFASPGQFNLAAQPLPGFTDQAGYRPRSAPRIARGSFRASLPQGNQGVPFPLQLRQPYQRLTLRRSAGRFFVPGQFNQVAPALPSFTRAGTSPQRLILRRSQGIFQLPGFGQGNQGTAFPQVLRQSQARRIVTVIRPARGQLFMQAWGQFTPPSGMTSGAEQQLPLIAPPFTTPGSFAQPWVPLTDPGITPGITAPVPQMLQRAARSVLRARSGRFFTPGQFTLSAQPYPSFTRAHPAPALPVRRGRWLNPGQFNLTGNAAPAPAWTRRPAAAPKVPRGRFASPGQFTLAAGQLPGFTRAPKRPAVAAIRRGAVFTVPAVPAVPAVPRFLSPRRPGPVLRKRGSEFQRIPAPAVIPAYPADFRTTRRVLFTRADALRRGKIIQLVPFQAAATQDLRISLGEPASRWTASDPAVRWSAP